MIRELLLNELHGRLWHTTHPQHFDAILASGAISTNPGISNWTPLSGEECCSYARKLGGVSLFDFDQFEPESYEEKYRLSSWYTFVPYLEKWGCVVWIEIDREKVAGSLISRLDLMTRWKADEAYKHNFMPEIEAVHIGPIPRAAFTRAFLVRKENNQFHSLQC